MSLIFLLLFVLLIIGATVYNTEHRKKYDDLMAHLQQHHPEIYEQISVKPSVGPFYTRSAYQTSIDYAQNHRPLADPIAEKLLTEYAEFSRNGIVALLKRAEPPSV